MFKASFYITRMCETISVNVLVSIIKDTLKKGNYILQKEQFPCYWVFEYLSQLSAREVFSPTHHRIIEWFGFFTGHLVQSHPLKITGSCHHILLYQKEGFRTVGWVGGCVPLTPHTMILCSLWGDTCIIYAQVIKHKANKNHKASERTKQ